MYCILRYLCCVEELRDSKIQDQLMSFSILLIFYREYWEVVSDIIHIIIMRVLLNSLRTCCDTSDNVCQELKNGSYCFLL